MTTVLQLLYAGSLLYIIANVLGKCATTLLIVRISRMRQQLLTCNVALVLIAAWGFGSLLAEALRCDLSHPWLYYGQQCSGLVSSLHDPSRTISLHCCSSFDGRSSRPSMLSLRQLCLPWHFGWYGTYRCHSCRKERSYLASHCDYRKSISTLCVLRLLLTTHRVIAAAILRVHFIGDISRSQPFITGVPAFVLTQVEMHYGLMAATIPCLKSFVGRFNTGWGQVPVQSTNGYAMQSKDKTASSVTEGQTSNSELPIRNDMRANAAKLTSGSARSGRDRANSLNSHSSQRNIIHKTVEWGVGHQADEESKLGGDQNYWESNWNGR